MVSGFVSARKEAFFPIPVKLGSKFFVSSGPLSDILPRISPLFRVGALPVTAVCQHSNDEHRNHESRRSHPEKA